MKRATLVVVNGVALSLRGLTGTLEKWFRGLRLIVLTLQPLELKLVQALCLVAIYPFWGMLH
jgi:hypothetical protein